MPESIDTKDLQYIVLSLSDTVCPRSSDQFYIVTYYIRWDTTSWTYSIFHNVIDSVYRSYLLVIRIFIEKLIGKTNVMPTESFI